MSRKNYDVAAALLTFQQDAKVSVRGNDTSRIEYHEWQGQPPTEAQIDAAGATVLAATENARAANQAAEAKLRSPPARDLNSLVDRVEALETILKHKGIL